MDAQAVAEQAVLNFLENDAFAKTLGVSTSHVLPGEVTAHLTVTQDMLNGHGSAHGAVLFTIADVAFAMACNSHAHDAIGRSCSIEYLSPAFVGDALTAEATERAVAGRSGIYDIAVRRDSDGQLLAEMRGHSRQLSVKPKA